MDDASINAWMNRAPTTISPQATLAHARSLIRHAQTSTLIVVDHGRVVGTVTERNIWDHCPTTAIVLDDTQANELLAQFRVSGVMTLHPQVLSPQASLREAAHLLAQGDRPGLPVVEDGRVIGVLEMQNLVQAMAALLGA